MQHGLSEPAPSVVSEKFTFRNSMTCLLPRGGESRGSNDERKRWKSRARGSTSDRHCVNNGVHATCTHAHNECHGKGTRESPGRVCGMKTEGFAALNSKYRGLNTRGGQGAHTPPVVTGRRTLSPLILPPRSCNVKARASTLLRSHARNCCGSRK